MDTPQTSGGYQPHVAPPDSGAVPAAQSHPHPLNPPPHPVPATHPQPPVQAPVPSVEDHKVLHPSEHFVQELHDQVPKKAPVVSHVTAAPAVPEAFKEVAQAAPTESAAALMASKMDQQVTEAISRPASGRWQMFWYAISVLTLGLLFIAASVVTSGGTLEKLLIGLKPNADEVLFGTRANITTANTLLGIFIVSLPLFIYSTLKVDRFRADHPNMSTIGLKKISYFFMVLAVITLVGQIASAIFQALNYTFTVLNIVPLLVDIGFVMAYFFWLYTTVSEDRKL